MTATPSTREQLLIPARFRAALLAKGALLAGMAALFLWLGLEAWARPGWPAAVRLGVAAACAGVAIFLGWAASLALLDMALGEAVRATGAAPLKRRWAGHSLKLPDGRFVEYILYNPWQPLRQGETYTVLFGRRSAVLVAPPRAEGAERPAPAAAFPHRG